MKRLRIFRVERSEDGIIGILTIDGKAFCYTLQPDERDAHFSIPEGSYAVKRFHGRTYPDTFEIVVAGHTALLFHILNQEDESEGCIGLGKMVGNINGKRAILGSGDAFKEFMRIMGDVQEADMFIQDCMS